MTMTNQSKKNTHSLIRNQYTITSCDSQEKYILFSAGNVQDALSCRAMNSLPFFSFSRLCDNLLINRNYHFRYSIQQCMVLSHVTGARHPFILWQIVIQAREQKKVPHSLRQNVKAKDKNE